MSASIDSQRPKTRRPLWRDHRLWSVIVVAAFLVTFLHDHNAFLNAEQKASFGVADYIGKHLTPSAFAAAFEDRANQCDYHWLFICEALPKPRMCPLDDPDLRACLMNLGGHSWFDPNRYRPRVSEDEGALALFWSGILALGQLPDTTWFVLKKTYQEGWLPFTLLLVFVVSNVLVAGRLPIIALPITLPICATIASGLFWVLGELVRLGANSAGALFWCLAAIAVLPTMIVATLGYIVRAKEFQDIAHETHRASGFVRDALQGKR